MNKNRAGGILNIDLMTNDKTQNSLNQTYFKLISLEALLAIPKPPFGTGVYRVRTHTCSLSVHIRGL